MVTGMAVARVVNGASIATAFFNHDIGSGQNAVAENFLARGREIRPIARLWRRPFGNNAANNLVPLPEFHSLAGAQPSLQPLGVPELANVYAGHEKHCVTVCDTLSTSQDWALFAPSQGPYETIEEP